LIVVTILNGMAGLVCGLLLLAKPDGSYLQAGALLPVLKTLPLASFFFRDFAWIGVAMLLALGVPNLIAAVMLLRQSEKQYVASLVAGVLLIAWCSFELIYLFNFAAVGYFFVGALSVLCSVLLARPTARSSAAS
jgi:branched-subunit amino acid transport protein